MRELFQAIGREIGVEPGNPPTISDRLGVKADIERWQSRYTEEHGRKPRPAEIADAGVRMWRKRGARI